MARTKVEAALVAAENEHADDPERAEVIARTRRFKASWIELAEALIEVRRGGRWKSWGYDAFESYTRQELHLKPETVEKLTGSFSFLQRRAPEVLRRDGVAAPLPSYQAVDFLRRAEEREGAPSEVVEQIRHRVLEEAAPLPSVAKQFQDTVFPLDESEKKKRDASGLRNVAGRLRDLLSDTRAVPRRLAGEVTAALEELLAHLEQEREREKERAA